MKPRELCHLDVSIRRLLQGSPLFSDRSRNCVFVAKFITINNSHHALTPFCDEARSQLNATVSIRAVIGITVRSNRRENGS